MVRDPAGDMWLADAEGLLMRLKDGLRQTPLGSEALKPCQRGE